MRRFPSPIAFVLIVVGSVWAASLTGVVGAVAGMFLYDRGLSKGDDLAVALIGVHSVGTFTFVVLFTFLWSRRALVSWKVPIGAMAACVCALSIMTILASSNYDEYYARFFLVAWVCVLSSGLAALIVCSGRVSTDSGHHSDDFK